MLPQLKLLFYNLFSAFLIYTLPIRERAIAILVLVLIDLVTGIAASITRSREAERRGLVGEKITSRRMRDTVTKFIGYTIALISSHIFTTHFGVDVVVVVSFYLAVVEFKSVMENLSIILKMDLYKTVSDFLGTKFKDILNARQK